MGRNSSITKSGYETVYQNFNISGCVPGFQSPVPGLPDLGDWRDEFV